MKTKSPSNNFPSSSVSIYIVGAKPDSALYLARLLLRGTVLLSRKDCFRIFSSAGSTCSQVDLDFPDKRMFQISFKAALHDRFFNDGPSFF